MLKTTNLILRTLGNNPESLANCRTLIISKNKTFLQRASRSVAPAVCVRRNMSSSTPEIQPPKCLLKPMNVAHKRLMGPGPSTASPRVLAAGAFPLIGHLHKDYMAILDEVQEGLRYVFQTNNNITLAVQGSGHAAMECAACNLIEPGDSVLVGVNGLWGNRFSSMAERNGGVVHHITKEMGTVFTLEDIEKGLKEHKPKVLFMVQAESSGSTCQPLEGIGDLCHKYDCLLIVDTVASMGGVPLYVDKWGIDICYSGSQKVLSVPPGVAPITFSEKAWQKSTQRKTKATSYYLDIMELANYWGCDGTPRRYHHTSPITTMYQLREGLAIVSEEGLEACWARHKKYGSMLQQGLRDMGLQLFAKDQENQLITVTAVKVPEGVDWKKVADFCMNEYLVEIAGGLGAAAGKVWRIGVMGYNCSEENVRYTLRVFREGLEHAGYKVDSKL